MYPSNTTNNTYDHDEAFPLTSMNQNHPLFHFPQQHDHHHQHSFLDNENECLITHFLSHHHQQQTQTPPAAVANKPIKKTKKKRTENNEANTITNPQKRSGKKDRHSKIYTAQGPRDRRMRLSLQIARKFFDLQDMLGFDKASKTIEWLFSKSKAAIKELADSLPGCSGGGGGGGGKSTLSSTSESEVVSSSAIFNKTFKKSIRKATAGTPLRESRDKARARARERTLEKMKIKEAAKQEQSEPNPNLQQNHIDSDSVSIIEKFLGISSSSLLDYPLNNVESSVVVSNQDNPVYPWNWENVGIDHQHQHQQQQQRRSYTTSKEPTGNNLLVQNPNSSIFINGDERNPSGSILMTSAQSHYPGDQFCTLY